jgi:hypothetical protein
VQSVIPELPELRVRKVILDQPEPQVPLELQELPELQELLALTVLTVLTVSMVKQFLMELLRHRLEPALMVISISTQ